MTLDQLKKQPWYKEWLENFDIGTKTDDNIKNFLHKYKGYEIIYCAFFTADTPQGHEYWSKIAYDLDLSEDKV